MIKFHGCNSEVFQSNTSQRLGSSAKGTMVWLPSWLSEATFVAALGLEDVPMRCHFFQRLATTGDGIVQILFRLVQQFSTWWGYSLLRQWKCRHPLAKVSIFSHPGRWSPRGSQWQEGSCWERGRAPRFCYRIFLLNPCFAILSCLFMPFPALVYYIGAILVVPCCESLVLFSVFSCCETSSRILMNECKHAILWIWLQWTLHPSTNMEKFLLRGRNSEGKRVSTALEQEAGDRLKCGWFLTLALGHGGTNWYGQ